VREAARKLKVGDRKNCPQDTSFLSRFTPLIHPHLPFLTSRISLIREAITAKLLSVITCGISSIEKGIML
jgi:hypothetical protein